MAAIRFAVTYKDDRKVEVRVSPKAQVMFEEKFDVGMGALSSQSMMKHLYYLAWAGLHCAGMEPNDFDTFLGQIEDVEGVESGENEDPTRNAPGTDPSSS
jgi:hypothetical protein